MRWKSGAFVRARIRLSSEGTSREKVKPSSRDCSLGPRISWAMLEGSATSRSVWDETSTAGGHRLGLVVTACQERLATERYSRQRRTCPDQEEVPGSSAGSPTQRNCLEITASPRWPGDHYEPHQQPLGCTWGARESERPGWASFASRRSPVRSRLAPLINALRIAPFAARSLGGSAPGNMQGPCNPVDVAVGCDVSERIGGEAPA
jgi:hypothetical protein